MPEARPIPEAIYHLCVALLLANDWYRDGLDTGVWHHGAGINPPGLSFEQAIAAQFLADGINFQS